MAFSIEAELVRRNKRYRAQGLRLYLEERNGRLVIRGMLPPKPGAVTEKLSRQRLDLGLPCTKLGVMEAEKKLKAVSAAIASDVFIWKTFERQKTDSKVKNLTTVKDAIKKAEKEYFKTRDRSDRKKMHSWKSNYMILYNQLPEEEVLTEIMLRDLITSKRAGTLHRNKTLYVCRYLASVNGLTLETEDIKTKTVRRTGSLRRPPSDELIVQTWKDIENYVEAKRRDMDYWKTVKWTYGMISTYGLRPHEVLHIEWNADNTINILQHKTDDRYGVRENVYPFHRNWVEDFELRSGKVLVHINEKNSRPGGRFVPQIANAFRTLNIGFRPYDLRHAYALRLMRYHVDFSIAAVMMGHTVDIHMSTYRKWIGEDLKREQLRNAYQEAEKTFVD
jgi:integrase